MGGGNVLGYRVWPAPQPGKYGGRLTHGTAGMSSKGSPDPSWCPIHKVKMKRREKNGGVWYSHKAKDGWCRGQAERKGARRGDSMTRSCTIREPDHEETQGSPGADRKRGSSETSPIADSFPWKLAPSILRLTAQHVAYPAHHTNARGR